MRNTNLPSNVVKTTLRLRKNEVLRRTKRWRI